jgi:hypothetical protein
MIAKFINWLLIKLRLRENPDLDAVNTYQKSSLQMLLNAHAFQQVSSMKFKEFKKTKKKTGKSKC